MSKEEVHPGTGGFLAIQGGTLLESAVVGSMGQRRRLAMRSYRCLVSGNERVGNVNS